VKDGKYRNVREDTWRTIYVPFAQTLDHPVGQMTLHVRATGNASVATIRSVVHELDTNLPILSVESLADRVERNLGVERLITYLSSSFGLLSLLLAALGLYGIIACSVSERTRELGIRIALGARPSNVIGMIMSHTGLLLVVGAVIGLAAALGLGRFVQSLLFGVVPNDSVAITITVLVLGLTALLASYVPARRSTQINPSVTLRYD
jgi:ABC-type antimicrobial peptide transport system permease subunit